MDLKKIAKIAGASALIAATGGLAAPVVGIGALGAIALTPVLTTTLTSVIAIGVVKNDSDAKKSKEQNEKLREELEKSNLDNKAKQKVIESLNQQLEAVKAELRAERKKSARNEEQIRYMKEQLDDLMSTLQTAYAA